MCKGFYCCWFCFLSSSKCLIRFCLTRVQLFAFVEIAESLSVSSKVFWKISLFLCHLSVFFLSDEGPPLPVSDNPATDRWFSLHDFPYTRLCVSVWWWEWAIQKQFQSTINEGKMLFSEMMQCILYICTKDVNGKIAVKLKKITHAHTVVNAEFQHHGQHSTVVLSVMLLILGLSEHLTLLCESMIINMHHVYVNVSDSQEASTVLVLSDGVRLMVTRIVQCIYVYVCVCVYGPLVGDIVVLFTDSMLACSDFDEGLSLHCSHLVIHCGFQN